ncbi:MAG: DUF4340 domain-containing protein [Desulfosudaceae bacterium]
MRLSKEYLVLFAIIIAAGLYLYFHQTDRLNYRLPAPAALDRAEMARLEIARPGGKSVILEKTSAGWQVTPGDYAADSDTVHTMLDAAADLDLSALVSESKDYLRYELTPDKALTVSVLAADGAVLRKIQVGKTAPTHQHTYVRLGEDHRVYQARGQLRRVFDKSADAVRDKTVLAFTPDDIRCIKTEGDSGGVTLARQETDGREKENDQAATAAAVPAAGNIAWVDTASGERADQETVAAWLEALSFLECRSFLGPDPGVGRDNPVYTVTLETAACGQPDTEEEGRAVYTLSLFPPAEESGPDYRGTASGTAEAFLLPAHQAERIMKTPDQLMGSAAEK